MFITGGKVPQDRTIVRTVLRTVSLSLFVSMGVVSVVGILWAIALVIFNIVYRHRRVIETSHPVCNTIMLVGVCLCLGSVFLLGKHSLLCLCRLDTIKIYHLPGLDGRFVEAGSYPAICQARAWILTLGFTLGYGAMFSKVWRVHRLTTKSKQDAKVSWHFLSYVPLFFF